jgi:peptidoglycan hydrolase-like protein with peptidoglycan-binding domain
MSDDDSNRGASIGAQHAANPLKFYVAPTEGSTSFNTIRIPLVPVACWRLGDPAFDFDSSFILPTFRGELAKLAALVQTNAGCPAAIFAHADPAGSDELNKTISDRRAIAVYALLTRQPSMWEDLYSGPVDGDAWDLRSIQAMLQTVAGRATDDNGNPLPPNSPYYAGAVDGAYGPVTNGAVKQFQTDAGLTADGDAGPNTRKVLFGAYMDTLCTPQAPPPASPTSDATAGPPPPAPTPFSMQPTDFLGGEGAANGDLPKMSLQGCSRFNPVVLLTNDEMSGSDKASRNANDVANRRVVVFFFANGTKMDASAWPCPKVKDPMDACKSAFWSDGDQRRKNGDERRTYETTRKTMACKFYDRFARRSPCEATQGSAFLVRLHDNEVKPISTTVPYRVTIGSGTPLSATSFDGWVSLPIPKDTCPARIRMEWGQPKSAGGAYPFAQDIVVECDVGEEKAQSAAKLNNIGYTVGTADALAQAVIQFQQDYGVAEHGQQADGSLPPQTRAKLWALYDENCDATRTSAAAPPAQDGGGTT